jgi:hypothetical protein
LQVRQTARDETDVRFGYIQRSDMKIAGRADAIDHMAGRPAGRQERLEGASGDRMHCAALAFQPGDKRGADEATGTKDGK